MQEVILGWIFFHFGWVQTNPNKPLRSLDVIWNDHCNHNKIACRICGSVMGTKSLSHARGNLYRACQLVKESHEAMQESRLLMPALSPADSYDGEAILMTPKSQVSFQTPQFFQMLDVGKTTNRAIPSFHRRGDWWLAGCCDIGMSWVRASRSWKVEAIISESWKRQFCGRDCCFVSSQKGWCFCSGTIGGGLWKVSKNLVIITEISYIFSCYSQYVII